MGRFILGATSCLAALVIMGEFEGKEVCCISAVSIVPLDGNRREITIRFCNGQNIKQLYRDHGLEPRTR